MGPGLEARYIERAIRWRERDVAIEILGGSSCLGPEPNSSTRISGIYEVGPNYVAMEPVEGVPLKGPLSLQETLRFATEICDALVCAHKHGIAHGGLNSSNVLVTQQGIKILDFGFAKADAQASSDIHAFGGLLYEMLMGRPIRKNRRPVEPPRSKQFCESAWNAIPRGAGDRQANSNRRWPRCRRAAASAAST